MLNLKDISYYHPNRELLFDNINLVVNSGEKIALIGNNGIGKSTLLKIIAGELRHSAGTLEADADLYFIPQIFGQYNHLTIAQALHVEEKLRALNEIMRGNASEQYYSMLNDDWTVEDRCNDALNYWQLSESDLSMKMEELSGGQKMKVFLAGISIHQPGLILLDEPSNHLDMPGRQLLYDFIQNSNASMIVVSHDRKLLNLLSTVCEMNKHGIKTYGGNYDFYKEQKQTENNAFNEVLQGKEKELRKAREKQRETMERQQRMDARGKKKQMKSGMPKTMMNKMKNDSENSTSKVKGVHAGKIEGISQELHELRLSRPDIDKMRFDFDNSTLHKGKVLFSAKNMNFGYDGLYLWKQNLDFQITSGERIALKGQNGSGKTSLINLILGNLEPESGSIHRAKANTIYIDQDYSLIDNNLNIYKQAQSFNVTALLEHEIKIRLNRFLFTREDWDKSCSNLSGGERMRLMLCCLVIKRKSPDIIFLDEPTNNLDIQNVEILTSVINDYAGTLIVVSHDERFLEEINIAREIELKSYNDKPNSLNPENA